MSKNRNITKQIVFYSHGPHILLEYFSAVQKGMNYWTAQHGWISKYYVEQKKSDPPPKKCMIHDFTYMTFENRQNWSVVIDIRKMIPEGRKRRRLPGKTAQGMFCGGRNVLYTDFCCLKWMYTFTKIQEIVHVYFVRFRVYKINVNKNFLKYSFSLSWIWFRVSNLIVFI